MASESKYREALESVRRSQRRAARAARVPWWVYAAMFALTAAATLCVTVLTMPGSQWVAMIVLAAFLVVFGLIVAGGHAPLDALRSVGRRQSFEPWVFGVVTVIGIAALWAATNFGAAIAGTVADAVGLVGFAYLVGAVLAGAAFTALFALGQLLSGIASRARR